MNKVVCRDGAYQIAGEISQTPALQHDSTAYYTGDQDWTRYETAKTYYESAK